jgi:hypothetical protein
MRYLTLLESHAEDLMLVKIADELLIYYQTEIEEKTLYDLYDLKPDQLNRYNRVYDSVDKICGYLIPNKEEYKMLRYTLFGINYVDNEVGAFEHGSEYQSPILFLNAKMIFERQPTNEQLSSVLNHELQHALDYSKNFHNINHDKTEKDYNIHKGKYYSPSKNQSDEDSYYSIPAEINARVAQAQRDLMDYRDLDAIQLKSKIDELLDKHDVRKYFYQTSYRRILNRMMQYYDSIS